MRRQKGNEGHCFCSYGPSCGISVPAGQVKSLGCGIKVFALWVWALAGGLRSQLTNSGRFKGSRVTAFEVRAQAVELVSQLGNYDLCYGVRIPAGELGPRPASLGPDSEVRVVGHGFWSCGPMWDYGPSWATEGSVVKLCLCLIKGAEVTAFEVRVRAVGLESQLTC